MDLKKILGVALLIFSTHSFAQQGCEFEPTVESLRQYECPEWFRDAKFGIWSCANAYSVPGQGDWYARNMYIEGSKAYKYHCKTYGHPSEFGYKDVVDLWKSENFDAADQIALFKEAGAKYFIAMANHHDNFDLWDSKYSEWNSVNYGPKRDIIAEWHKATLDAGLRWGVTSHVERAVCWMQTSKQSDKQGAYKGIPYDGANPEYSYAYFNTKPTDEDSPYQPTNAPMWWREQWLNRCKDLIDNYQPDLFYVDGGVPFPGEDQGVTGMKMLSHLYNKSIERHNGENEAVMCIKDWYEIAPNGDWGFYWDGVATLDFEKGSSDEILETPWQTDTNLGDWTWVPGMKYRSAESLVEELIDVVSKNGNLLVNISPRPDGTLDEDITALLKSVGSWMKVNSESIYETRPWLISGVDNMRVVKKSDNTLYVTTFDKPEGENITIPFLASEASSTKIKSIKMLGCDKKLSFKTTDEGVVISLPKSFGGEFAWVFKIEGSDLDKYNVEHHTTPHVDVAGEIQAWYDNAQLEEVEPAWSAIAYDSEGVKWGVSRDNDLIEGIDTVQNLYVHKVRDLDFTASGYAGFVTISGDIYFGKGHDWKRIAELQDGYRLSISESGDIYCVDTSGRVWLKKLGEKPKQVVAPNVVDIACGSNGEFAMVDNFGHLMLGNDGRRTGWYKGVGLEHVEYSPKSGYLTAILDGEIAIYKDDKWVLTGVQATAISCGVKNNKEIMGWVAKHRRGSSLGNSM